MSTQPMDLLDLAATVDALVRRAVRVGDCLIVPAGRYAEVKVSGVRIGAHRAIVLLRDGSIPEGHVVRHACDTPRCIEPSHLTSGTQAQNIREMYDRGRASANKRRGEGHFHAVLTGDLVRAFRRRVLAGEGIRAIARDEGLGYSLVRNAVRGVSWAHIVDPPPISSDTTWQTANARRLEVARPNLVSAVKALHEQGVSLAEIGRRLGIAKHTAWKASHREVVS